CKPSYKAAFWDRECLGFSLVQVPQWLELDPQTGDISGTPGIEDVGEHEVVVQVTNSQGHVAKRRFFMEVISR
ncbi:MAG: putative Ig domain-containing protein, partial [Planctomycetota bacterium]